MTARINHEHAEREALEHERLGLLKKKQALIAENKKRKDDLASLDSDLEKFIDVVSPDSRPDFITDDIRLLNRYRQRSKKTTRTLEHRARVNSYLIVPVFLFQSQVPSRSLGGPLVQ